ncbi:Erg28 like domain containing protein [Rhypophila decipiens]
MIGRAPSAPSGLFDWLAALCGVNCDLGHDNPVPSPRSTQWCAISPLQPEHALTQFQGPLAPPPHSLTARVYGVKNIYTALIRAYAAYHITNSQLYTLAMFTYVGALGLYATEVFYYKTTKVREPTSTFVDYFGYRLDGVVEGLLYWLWRDLTGAAGALGPACVWRCWVPCTWRPDFMLKEQPQHTVGVDSEFDKSSP